MAAAVFAARAPELATIPSVGQRLLRLAKDPRTTTQQLAQCIVMDPALASTVLRYANSPIYGAREPIREIVSAIIVLGFHQVCDLGVAASVRALDAPDEHADAHWRRSLVVASAASRLARAILGGRGGDETFVAGLLHDIGEVVLRRVTPEVFKQCYRAALAEEDSCALTAANLGFHAGELGAAVIRTWNLAPEIAACALHYADSSALARGLVNGEQALLLWIVQAARLIAAEATRGLAEDVVAARFAWLCRCAPVAEASRSACERAWRETRASMLGALTRPQQKPNAA